jgi:uncharacterized lipoprotein NlpE involved in copper resistance
MKSILILVALTFTVCGCANQSILDDSVNTKADSLNKLGTKTIDPSNDPYNK